MPRGKTKLTASRREEIVNACEKLCQIMSSKDITIKGISMETIFSNKHTAIYAYLI